MNVALLIHALTLGTTIQVCDVDGVPTYTDRSDICDHSQPFEATSGTFSTVDDWVAPKNPVATPGDATQPQVIIVEHVIKQPVYLYPPEQPAYFTGFNRRFARQRPSYPFLPDLRPSLYRDRIGHATMPHQRSEFLGKRYQSASILAHPGPRLRRTLEPESAADRLTRLTGSR